MLVRARFDYLLKVRSRDIQDYRRLYDEVLSRLPHVQQTHTLVVMEIAKGEMALPVPHG